MLLNSDQANGMHRDLVDAIATGLLVGIAPNALEVLMPDHSFDLVRFITNVLTCVAAYTAVALLLHRYWTGLLQRMVPKWTLIAIAGTLVLVCIMGVEQAISRWNDPFRTERALPEFLIAEVSSLRILFLLLCCIALPTTAIVHYATQVAKAVRRTEKPPSILGNQRT